MPSTPLDLPDRSPQLPLGLGCPAWNCDGWGNVVYPAKTPRARWLHWYTRMFNAVEGNSCFYALPTHEQVQRWVAEAAPGFRFCMKFPRTISHDCQLAGAQQPTQAFLEVLELLAEADRMGPSFLQLGPSFGPDRVSLLETYLKSLPRRWPWAVEVRHPDWFDSGANERRLNEILGELEIDKVLFDSRPLYHAPPDDEVERRAQERKPRTPVRQTITGNRPMLRLIGRNRAELVDRFLDQWVPIVAGWIASGHQPFVFAHAPDDKFAPQLARRFWQRLAEFLPEPRPELPELPQPPRQLDLSFG